MSARAFAPAHVTGLFAVHDAAEDPLLKGSRGAGWSLQRGAYAEVDEAARTVVRVDGEPDAAPVTQDALARLAPDASFEVGLLHELPGGQGFGMSAAGTLAACLAATSVLGLEPEAALQATHAAEVLNGTGLGDAVGSWFGNGELRVKPGCPPNGWAMRIEAPDDARFLFCVLDDPLPTNAVIRNDAWRERTRRHGDPAVDRILDVGRPQAWKRILIESAVFSHKLGLMPPRMVALGAQMPDGLTWGQCMLGGTLWVAGGPGDLERAEAVLEGHGDTFTVGVDGNGARLVRQMPHARA